LCAWRLLRMEVYDAFMNMAIDEAILTAIIEGGASNTLRFYRWNPSAVSIGRFQSIHKEVNLLSCGMSGVDVVRRISGGGAVYHDYRNEVTYSVIVRKADLGVEDASQAYQKICQGLIEAAQTLGVKAEFNVGDYKQCPNITINGRKFSGSAQCHRKGALLQHGTFLVDVDLKRMFTFLLVPWAETCLEVVNVAQNKITSVRRETGRKIGLEEAEEALIEGFRKALDVELVEGELTKYEEELADILRRRKFESYDWNFHGKTLEKMRGDHRLEQ